MKNIAVLGSSGSIGRNALDVVRRFPREFRVASLGVQSNIDVLKQQIKEFHITKVSVTDKSAALKLEKESLRGVTVLSGNAGMEELCKDPSVDGIIMAVSGAEALAPLLASIEYGKTIALANKEALVMAGPLIMKKARKSGAVIIPVDSEQSAIWQCLRGEEEKALRTIYLTASGGPFLGWDKKKLQTVSTEEVLCHPRWKMGRKITVDSATLMNKGLELLEAMYLFDVSADTIEVLIHPEAIIHSMTEFIDGVIMAQLSATDMRIPIQYAMTFPQRCNSTLERLDFCKLGTMHFEKPDVKNFPCLRLAYWVAKEGGTLPCVLNAANEVCVSDFLNKRLKFSAIPRVIEKVLMKHRNNRDPKFSDIMSADAWARAEAVKLLSL